MLQYSLCYVLITQICIRENNFEEKICLNIFIITFETIEQWGHIQNKRYRF